MKVLRTFPSLEKAYAYFKYLKAIRGDRYSVHDNSVHTPLEPWAVSEVSRTLCVVLPFRRRT